MATTGQTVIDIDLTIYPCVSQWTDTRVVGAILRHTCSTIVTLEGKTCVIIISACPAVDTHTTVALVVIDHVDALSSMAG